MLMRSESVRGPATASVPVISGINRQRYGTVLIGGWGIAQAVKSGVQVSLRAGNHNGPGAIARRSDTGSGAKRQGALRHAERHRQVATRDVRVGNTDGVAIS